MRLKLLILAIAFCASNVHAEVKDAGANGFTITHAFLAKGTPQEVYQKIIDVGNWWNGEHTYSGDAHNLTLDAKAGGCWCERLPKNGGSVMHMQVLTASPGMFLVMTGGLGPLQRMGVSGAMTFQLSAAGGGTKVEFIYVASGYAPSGMASIAPMVDSVLMQQMSRLNNFIDTGSAAAKKLQ